MRTACLARVVSIGLLPRSRRRGRRGRQRWSDAAARVSPPWWSRRARARPPPRRRRQRRHLSRRPQRPVGDARCRRRWQGRVGDAVRRRERHRSAHLQELAVCLRRRRRVPLSAQEGRARARPARAKPWSRNSRTERQHSDKTFALDAKGTLYINVGAPSNSCQEKDRQEGSLGSEPVPDPREIRRRVGVRRHQAQPDACERQALRDRHAQCRGHRMERRDRRRCSPSFTAAIPWIRLFPALYNAEDNATRQAEEFHQIVDGGNYGWPYTFFDTKLGKRVLAPEYGGDAKKEPEAGKYPNPLVAFPRTGRLTTCCSTRARTSRRNIRTAPSSHSTAAGIARPSRRPDTRWCSSP